jgi:hypothetical protein
VNRELTEQEKNWLIDGLKTLETGEYFGGGRWIDLDTNETKEHDEPIDAEFFIAQIDELRVVDKCTCGEANCHTVKFQNFEVGKSVAIVCSATEDKRMLIIHINEDTDKLAELEII